MPRWVAVCVAERQHNTEESGYVRPRETDSLHEALQAHILTCDHCREAIDQTGPRGFGQRSRMCPLYFSIVENYSKTGNV